MDSRRTRRRPAVFAKEVSGNPKMGEVSATYVAQQSCAPTCPFLGAGCYAENGFLGGFITKRLNRGVPPDITPLEIAEEEAAAIDRLTGERDLRLHVVGDSITAQATKWIAEAAERYIRRGGRKVSTYTHAWHAVPRLAWGSIGVLASCETEQDVKGAHERGYATAIVVERHEREGLHRVGHIKVLPCGEQTRGMSCVDCRLCMDDVRLRAAGITVALAAHGSPASKNKALRTLPHDVAIPVDEELTAPGAEGVLQAVPGSVPEIRIENPRLLGQAMGALQRGDARRGIGELLGWMVAGEVQGSFRPDVP